MFNKFKSEKIIKTIKKMVTVTALGAMVSVSLLNVNAASFGWNVRHVFNVPSQNILSVGKNVVATKTTSSVKITSYTGDAHIYAIVGAQYGYGEAKLITGKGTYSFSTYKHKVGEKLCFTVNYTDYGTKNSSAAGTTTY